MRGSGSPLAPTPLHSHPALELPNGSQQPPQPPLEPAPCERPLRRQRPSLPLLRSPVAAAINGGGQWLFCGELAGRPGDPRVLVSQPARSTPCSPAAPSHFPLVRSRSAASAMSPQQRQLRRAFPALRPLPKRSLPALAAASAVESGREESQRLLAMRPPPSPASLTRCRSDPALASSPDATALSWLESALLLPTAVESPLGDSHGHGASPCAAGGSPRPGQVRPLSEPVAAEAPQAPALRPGAFKKRKGGIRAADWCNGESNVDRSNSWEWDAPSRCEPRQVRFLEMSRSFRKSWSSSKPGGCGGAGDMQVEVGHFLERELSCLRRQFSALDDLGTPRLLESELLGLVA
jgi:hypothetical protein